MKRLNKNKIDWLTVSIIALLCAAGGLVVLIIESAGSAM